MQRTPLPMALWPPFAATLILLATGCQAVDENASNDMAADSAAPAAVSSISLPAAVPGEWISRQLIDDVQHRHALLPSVVELARSDNSSPLWMRFDPSGVRPTLTRSWDLHDSALDSIASVTGVGPDRYVVRLDASGPDTLAIDDDGASPVLTWIDTAGGSEAATHYVPATPSIESMLNRALIAGTWRDDHGVVYDFFDNGTAIWNRDTVSYQLLFDGFDLNPDFDYMAVTGSDGQERIYAIEHHDDRFVLNDIGTREQLADADAASIRSKKFATLHRAP